MARGARTRSAFAAACVLGALLVGAAPAHGDLASEIRAVSDQVVRVWRAQQADGTGFPNPRPAEVAQGRGGFAPPMLMYAMQRAGERLGEPGLVEGAERAWPSAVGIDHASVFDVVGAAYAYRQLALSASVREHLANYLRGWMIPPLATPPGCAVRPGCHHNLVLVDALAILAANATGLRSAIPGSRLAEVERWQAHAIAVVGERVPAVVDHALRARVGTQSIRGSILSDPPKNPLAYHALSTFMLAEALKHLGAAATPAAQGALREALDALSVLVAPDGDVSYMGRGQGQVWVPALTVAAMVHGAALVAGSDPAAAARYVAVARRALARLRTLHVSPEGFLVVPGARATTAGVDDYAHTVAYNGLALFGLTVAAETATALPPLPEAAMPADQRLRVTDQYASDIGVLSTGRIWLAVHRRSGPGRDARYDFGLLALKRRRADGSWHDLLTPRPLTAESWSAGPLLVRGGRLLRPAGRRITIRRGAIALTEPFIRRGARRPRTVVYRPRGDGVDIELRGVRKRQRVKFRIFTPAGTGAIGTRAVAANGALWKFPGRVRGHRIGGFHSGPVENLDALSVSVRAYRKGRLTITVAPEPGTS
jgi:hypothetical protein